MIVALGIAAAARGGKGRWSIVGGLPLALGITVGLIGGDHERGGDPPLISRSEPAGSGLGPRLGVHEHLFEMGLIR